MQATRRSLVHAGGCALVAGLAIALAADPPWPSAVAANGFAFDLYARLSSAEGNLFVSPFSVRAALGMTYVGARGETAAQAFVAVDEEGTEAAAATGAVMLPASASPPPVFPADRPFLFLIRAEATGDVVFLGRLVDPAER